MARPSFCITCILLFSFLIIASASEYSYEKPEGKQEPDLHTKLVYKQPKPEEKEKLLHYNKPHYEKQNPEENEKPLYKKPNYEKKPDEKEKFIPEKIDYNQQKSEGKEKIPITLPEYKQPKPEEKEKYFPTKPIYNEGPNKEEKKKYFPTKPIYKENPTKEDEEKYLPTKPIYKEEPKKEVKEKYYPTEPIYNEEPKKEKYFPTKPIYKEEPKSEEKEKFTPTYDELIPTKLVYGAPKQNYEEEKYELPRTIGVQGLVYCKSGLKYSPLPGAVTRITCVAEHEKSYKTTQYSVLSKPCDSKGYFYATISPETVLGRLWKIKDCKAYLDHSPLKTCKVPTNVNNGISGYSFASNYDILTRHNDVKLFSVRPFFYTSSVDQHYDKQTVPNGDGY